VVGVTSQSVMSVDGEEIPGKALEKRRCMSLLAKAGRAQKEGRKMTLFQVAILKFIL
jgi:hypothetical protein